jgi:hypothetical protein
MRKLATLTVSATLALATLAQPAHAGFSFCSIYPPACTTPRAPEIDPTALRSALVVLAGGVLMLAERRRRR